MIYVDIDGVLADFYGGVRKLTGKEFSKESYSEIEKVDQFFYNLDILPEAKRYMCSLVFNTNVQILGAIPLPTGKLISAQRDKVEWIHTNISPSLQVNIVQDWSFKKYFCSGDHDILIDDSERNVKDWTDSGGYSILHKDWPSTWKQLKEKING